MEFGIIGLGRMGANLARQAGGKGIRVVGFSRTRKEDLLKEGIELASDIGGLAALLSPPRVVFLYVPAGPTVDQVMKELGKALRC